MGRSGATSPRSLAGIASGWRLPAKTTREDSSIAAMRLVAGGLVCARNSPGGWVKNTAESIEPASRYLWRGMASLDSDGWLVERFIAEIACRGKLNLPADCFTLLLANCARHDSSCCCSSGRPWRRNRLQLFWYFGT